jgi:hypothetical protein
MEGVAEEELVGKPILISVGADGERTINERVVAAAGAASEGPDDVFQLERRRREVEKRLREIEAREAVLKGCARPRLHSYFHPPPHVNSSTDLGATTGRAVGQREASEAETMTWATVPPLMTRPPTRSPSVVSCRRLSLPHKSPPGRTRPSTPPTWTKAATANALGTEETKTAVPTTPAEAMPTTRAAAAAAR